MSKLTHFEYIILLLFSLTPLSFNSSQRINMENIFTSSKPFLTFAKGLGFFPMSVATSSRVCTIKVKWFDICLSVCSFLALISLNIVTLLKYNSLAFTESSFLLSAWDMTRKVELFSYFFLFSYQLQRRKQILEFLEKLHNFDEKVRKAAFEKLSKISLYFAGKNVFHFDSS